MKENENLFNKDGKVEMRLGIISMVHHFSKNKGAGCVAEQPSCLVYRAGNGVVQTRKKTRLIVLYGQ